MLSTARTCITVVALGFASTAFAAPDYEVSQIPLMPGWPHLMPRDMNAYGHAVGNAFAGLGQLERAFYFDGVTTHDFTQPLIDTVPPEYWLVETTAHAINDLGQVLVNLAVVDLGVFPHIWDGEKFTEVSPAIPAGDWDFADASASAINNLGQIAGTMRFIKNNPPTLWYNAFVWDPATDETTLIEPPAPFGQSVVNDLSDTGYVTGHFFGGPIVATGFIWKDGELTLFEGVDEDDYLSISRRINNDGFAAAFTTNQPPAGAPSLSRVFLWSQAGVHEWAYPLDGLTSFDVNGLNAGNEIVGTMYGPQEPFHFHNGVMRNLKNQLAPSELTVDLWEAHAINDAGMILASGDYFGPGDWSYSGFILTPKGAGPANPADLNGDGVVNVFDLLILLAEWGPCPATAPCAADLDGNGVVDVFDLLALLAHWG